MKVVTTNQFRKDYKRIKKRGYDLSLLGSVIDTLLSDNQLDPKHHNHPLSGNWSGYMECHIQPDWLLIYHIDKDLLILSLSRTGNHSDLFNQ